MLTTARCVAVALIAPGALLWACRPKCPEYWELACQACGDSSPACQSAKEVGQTLTDDDECTATKAALKDVLEQPAAKRRYCNQADTKSDGDLDALTSGPWICNGRRVTFGAHSFKIDDELHELTNVSIAQFELSSGPAVERKKGDGVLQCRYDLGTHAWSGDEVALALHCPPDLGLPTKWEPCLREKP